MKIKLLKIELTTDEEGKEIMIDTHYGNILDTEAFKDMKKQLVKLKTKFEKEAIKMFEGSEENK